MPVIEAAHLAPTPSADWLQSEQGHSPCRIAAIRGSRHSDRITSSTSKYLRKAASFPPMYLGRLHTVHVSAPAFSAVYRPQQLRQAGIWCCLQVGCACGKYGTVSQEKDKLELVGDQGERGPGALGVRGRGAGVARRPRVRVRGARGAGAGPLRVRGRGVGGAHRSGVRGRPRGRGRS
jgi:hypothetical protein